MTQEMKTNTQGVKLCYECRLSPAKVLGLCHKCNIAKLKRVLATKTGQK